MAGLLAAGLLLGSCARLRVESNPPGARVLWSENGITGWYDWPPVAEARKDDLEVLTAGLAASTSDTAMTPFAGREFVGDTIFITVEKDGYYRPLPQVAELYAFRNEKLTFDLVADPETFARAQRAKGLVSYGGEWVDPVEKELAEYKGSWIPADLAFEYAQRDQGLVQYDEQWVTPQERDRLLATDRLAQGYVEFKGRWVMPEVREQETLIDREVDRIAVTDALRLDPPRVIGRIDADAARVGLVNATGERMRFLFSGPISREVTLEPLETLGLRASGGLIVPGGRYRVAAIPAFEGVGQDGVSLNVQFGEEPLAEGFRYEFTYSGGEDFEFDNLGDYELEEPEMPYEIPDIEIPEVRLPDQDQEQRGGRRGGGQPAGGGGGRRGQ
ncbi:MAG: hypothetical protein RLY93_13435 [Sumerlaeia bacterium]